MATINLDKANALYANSPELQGQFIDYLRNVESDLDFSKFEGLDNQAIFTSLMESRPEIKLNANNPAKPLDYRPRREQTYKELKALDDELENQPFYKDLAMRATQVLDQINPTPFRQKELETRRQKAQEIINHLKKSGVTSEQFQKEYGDSPFLREAYFENQDIFSNIFDLSHDASAAIFGGKGAQAKAYDFELESYNNYKAIAQRKLDTPSNYYKLTPQERAIIEQRVGAISSWWRNNSDKELVDYYLDLENAKESASNFVSAQKRLENVNSNEQFLGLIGALKHGKEFDKKQKAMIEDYGIVAKELGFDTLAYNKTGLYFIKDEKAYKVEQGLWDEIKGVFKDNIGSLAGAIAGAEYGYKKGKFKGMVIYGAAGAFGGGVTDSMIADVLANKKLDLAQALIHGAQEGALNIAADAVLKVAGTAIKTLNPEKLKNIAGTAIDYTPVLGFISRAHDGNKAAAQKLINTTLPKELQAELKELESIFGASVEIGQANTTKAAKALESIKQRLGSDSTLAKGAQKFYDTFAFTDQKQAQKDFIRAIRADESGNLTAFLSEAANASPTLQKSLQAVLGQTTEKLLHQLERFELAPSTIKDVFNNFEKGTKDSYKQAIEDILQGVYDDSYRVVLKRDEPNYPEHLELGEVSKFNTQSYDSFKQKLLDSGVMVEDSAKFLQFVEASIYNPKGVSFESLNNALKTINAYHKQASDPNFRSFVKEAVNGFIKRDIQAGIEAIFAQNKALYNDARTLFDTALSDYAKMKETLKLVDKLKVRDRAASYEQVANSLSRFFLAQGDSIPNFEALLGTLPKHAREQVELKLLQDMLEISLVRYGESSVLDSSEFFKRLDPLKAHFHSKSAQDFIKIAQDFHTLFRNDAKILSTLAPTTTEKMGSSIATTLEGAIKFQVIKALFANVVRLLPHIPFAKGLNEKVQGAALRFHLKKALDSSLSVGEFKLELQARAIKGDFTNATREQIAKILGQVDSAQESLERASTTPSPTPKPNANLHPIDSQEATELAEHFNFKGAKPLVREARENEIAHALKSHGDQTTEAQRGNIAITRADIETNYPKITQEHDEKFYTDTGVIYVKQVNGHHIAIEEALLGQDKLIFKTMWKTKGNYNKEVLLKNAKASPYPHNADEAVKSESISNPSLEQGSPLQSHQSTSNSTTLSPLEQAKLDKQAKEQAAKLAQEAKEQAAREQAQAIKEHNDTHQKLKDQSLGKAINDRLIKHKDPIALKHTNLPRESIAISDDEIIPLDLVVVKASDIEPNFYASEFQPRTSKNTKVIEAIAQNFTPELVLGRGGYKDLPIINNEGKVIIGNHRVQGFKDFSQSSRAAYESAIKDRYGIELGSDELLLRIPSDSSISDEKLLSIAFHSNKDDIKNIGDKVSAALGKYDQAIKELPNEPFTSESVEELKSKVAHTLAKGELLPDEREANLALLASLARSSEQSDIIKALDSLPKILAPQEKQALQNMFIDNAGSFFNLSRNTLEYGLRNMDIRPYIAESIEATANALQKERWQNFEQLNQSIKYLLDSTDERGLNPMLESNFTSYDDVIAQALGAALARFARLENPSSNLYEALKNAPKELEALHAPAFDFESGGVTAGKRLQDMDILDLVDYLARSGEASQALREFVDLLPSFRQKWQNARASKAQASTPKAPSAQKVESSEPLQTLRDNLEQALAPILHKDIQNTSTGIAAQISKTSIKKMTSDKAIQKSVDNGFSQEQHFAAAQKIQELYENAQHILTRGDDKNNDKAIVLHEFISTMSNEAAAKILVKESLDKDSRRIYTLELQELIPPLPANPRTDGSKSGTHSKSLQESGAPLTPLENATADSTTKTFNQADIKLESMQDFSQEQLEQLAKIDKKIQAEQERLERLKETKAYRFTQAYRDEIKAELESILKIATGKDRHTLINALKNLDKEVQKDINAIEQSIIEAQADLKNLHAEKQKVLASQTPLEAPTPPRHKLPKITDDYIRQTIENPLKDYTTLDPQGKAALKEAFMQKFKAARENSKKWQDLRTILRNFEAHDDALALQTLKESNTLDSTPIADFGENFSEFKGQGAKAVEKVLQERSGQVQGAFYRDELGEIDVVWGEITNPEKHKGYGLAHILDKRKAEFMQQGLSADQAEAKAIDFTKNEIANIIENGKITNKPNEATKIETPEYKLILKQNWKGEPLENKWLVTAYIKNEKGESISSTPFTKGDNLPLNSASDSTTKTFNQADIKLESMQDFSHYAKLAGFENLSAEQLERAHKHILTNLEKLRC